LFVREGHKGYPALQRVIQDLERDEEVKLQPGLFPISGMVLWSRDCHESGGEVRSPVAGQKAVLNNKTVCVRYRDPKYWQGFFKTYN
jgi:hypothetical protein